MIIGFSGYARSGKDTAAQALKSEGFVVAAFADILRDALLKLNPIVGDEARLSDVIESSGWDGYKTGPYGVEIRELLQRLGTEVGRNLLGENIWVDALFDKYAGVENLAISDVRFPNEAQKIKDMNGYVVRIYRKGVLAANDHPSEIALAGWNFDAFIQNDGTIDDLGKNVKASLRLLDSGLAWAGWYR